MSRILVWDKGRNSIFSQLVRHIMFHPCLLMGGNGKDVKGKEARMFSNLDMALEGEELENLKIFS